MRFLMSTLYIAALVACTDGKSGTVEQNDCLGSEVETSGYDYGCSQALQVRHCGSAAALAPIAQRCGNGIGLSLCHRLRQVG